MNQAMTRLFIAAIAAAAMASSAAYAHGDGQTISSAGKPKSTGTATAFGRPGDPAKIDRTVPIAMSDAMRFSPANLRLRRGETVRFIASNEGKVLHELVLGTDEELRKHAQLMRRFPDMEHDEPYMTHVKPGAKGDIVWTFDKAGTFSFACLIPGHFEAGMVGTVVVK
jgi:uncharacterized cupredoxin-like copper-binding protein